MHNQSVDAHSVVVVQVRSHFGTCVFLDRFSVSETTMPKKGKTGARAASRAPSDVASDGSQADDIVEEATTVAGSKGRKRPSADQLVTVPVAKRRKGAVALCGRCDAKSSDMPFHMVVAGNNTEKVESTACLRCYKPFAVYWHLKFTWVALCAKCSSDKDINMAFEQTCRVEEASLDVDVPRSQVETVVETGYTVIGNLALVDQKDLSTLLDTTMSPQCSQDQT